MPNNQAFIDAIIAGAGGGAQTAWLSSSDPNTYNTFATAVNAIATAVDALIPPIVPGPSLSQINLLKTIASAVFDGRYPTTSTTGTYSDIATRIVVLYTKLGASLSNVPDLYASTDVISGSGPVVSLGVDGVITLLAQTVTGLGASKTYVATIGIRVSAWPTAALSEASEFDCCVTMIAVTNGAGVATITLQTTPLFDLSLAHTNMRTTVCNVAPSAGGFTITAARPTGVACKAATLWWIANDWREVTS